MTHECSYLLCARFSFEGKLGLWDLTFWAERLKEEKYGIKEEELRCVAQSISNPRTDTRVPLP